MLLAVLGVVYGDIGTSPLYAFKTSLVLFDLAKTTTTEIMGVLSLIFWSLVIIVTVKYVMLVMRADNRGEGGILALMALAQRVSVGRGIKSAIAFVGIVGTCLFFGDGTITPAISVLSALEGLEVSAPELQPYVLPLAVIVIACLFTMQYHGTGRVGRVFGPIMLMWFTSIGLLGLVEILGHPYVLLAVSPAYAVNLVIHYKGMAFFVLGAVVLCVTGAEALYADMGHFGAWRIRVAWTFFVLPCLVLNYFGQGALMIDDPAAIANPFFLLGPDWSHLPMVVLATLATVIASQAGISGSFSLARQCMQLGFLPRLTVRHTSTMEEGQIYVPQVNVALAVGSILLILSFKTSDALASAYGIAVTGTFMCTALLATVVFRRQFRWPRTAAIGVFGTLFLIDTVFFSANTVKIVEGGWVPLVLGVSLTAMMMSWKEGREILLSRWKQSSMPLAPFLARLPQSRIIRVPGLAVFMTSNPDYVPTSLLHNLKHNKVLHESVLFVTVQTEDVPEVPADRRAEVSELAPGIHRVILRYGFMESPNIPRELEDLTDRIGVRASQASYFLGREVLVPGLAPKLPWWRRMLFLFMARNAVPATEFFRIPSDRVVELGVRITI
ncbi:MAG TPA: potassium transporter Kup [Rhodopila sp.]|jgi:KUP system potassium uptake protein|nr:potassium transporter Kup [Rhodopila sp.]HVZ08647.1 potassium transporter Kup [Rhodopila sp.]